MNTSVDLTLSNEFRYYKPGLSLLPVKESTNYKDITEKIILKDGETYLLLPGLFFFLIIDKGQACLGITQETIKLSPKLCGLLGIASILLNKTEGRSRFARLGLFVHITAGFMNPGIANRQVLEIYNASNVIFITFTYITFKAPIGISPRNESLPVHFHENGWRRNLHWKLQNPNGTVKSQNQELSNRCCEFFIAVDTCHNLYSIQ